MMMSKIKFYKEPNFKEAPIGKIPENWEVVKLGTILNLRNGQRPKISENGNIPVFGANGIMGYTDEFLADNDFTIVIGRVGASGEIHLGKGKIWVSDNAIYSENYDKLKAYLPYLSYLLKSKKLDRYASKTTHPIITQTFLNNFLIQRPERLEQQGIVEVLSVVDLIIGKVDEVIAKTERLKKGLMQELLTKGIGHKEFKDTKIGETPKQWQVVRLKDVIFEAKSGFASGKRDNNGILQLRMDSIKTEGWINTEAGVKVPIPQNVEDYILRAGDIVFNNTNSVKLIGKTAIFRGEFARCVYSNHLTRIRVNPNKVTAEWILYVLIKKWQQGIFKAICHRHVHQAGINNNDLTNLRIPLAPISEQQKIDEILSTVDKKLKLERNEKAKLERVKLGLMDLLLTGKVRVKVAD